MKVFGLIALFQFKHFLCDFILQFDFMLGKFLGGQKWIFPLLSHCLVHGIFTYLIALCVTPKYALLAALLDAAIHFAVDRVKASPTFLGRYKALSAIEFKANKERVVSHTLTLKESNLTPEMRAVYEDALVATKASLRSNKYFWWALGADQLAHQLTDLLIVWILL